VLAFGVTNLEKVFRQVRVLEYWMKKVTGIVFILVGLYYVSAHIFYFHPFL
jgi:cytochrome c biogenesis protein CcdA